MGLTLLGSLTVVLSFIVAVVVGVGSAFLSRQQWFMRARKYIGFALMVLPLAAIWFTGCGLADISNHSSGEINAGFAIIASLLSAMAILVEFAMFCGVLIVLSCEWSPDGLQIRSGSLVDRMYQNWYSNPYVWKDGKKQNICFLSWKLLAMILFEYPVVYIVGTVLLVVASAVTLLFSGKVVYLNDQKNPATKQAIGFAPIVPLALSAAIVAPVMVGMRLANCDLKQVLTTSWGLTSIIVLVLAVSHQAWSHPVIRPRARRAKPVILDHPQPVSKVDQAVISGLTTIRDGARSGFTMMCKIKQAACPVIQSVDD